MKKITTGDWVIENDADHIWIESEGRETTICSVTPSYPRINIYTDEDRSNAALISAAPKLLEALENIERICNKGDVNIQPLLDPIKEIAKNAIEASIFNY